MSWDEDWMRMMVGYGPTKDSDACWGFCLNTRKVLFQFNYQNELEEERASEEVAIWIGQR